MEGCVEVHRGAQRYAEVYRGVCRGAQRGAWRGAWRCVEVFQRGGGEKNQDFMLIGFLNDGI